LVSAPVWGAGGRWFKSSRPDFFVGDSSLLILLSNDDGVSSEGLHSLREILLMTDDVWVVAPDSERTCAGHAITVHDPLRINDHGNQVFSTNGTPADSVVLAVHVVLPRKPDLVISGINKGPNLGQDVVYSGTVAAAKEGAFSAVASMAVSINGRKDFLFKEAALSVRDIVNKFRNCTLPPPTFLNVNIPNIPYEKIRGIEVTSLGKRIYNGNIIERHDPRGAKYYWLGGDAGTYEPIIGTDLHAVHEGYISITPLHWDLTSYGSLDQVRSILSQGAL
jgi:5'-nucleotidase